MAKILYCQSLTDNLNRLGFDLDEPNYELVLFWGCAKDKKVKVDKSCLSNHFVRKFTYSGIEFNSVEQGMMYLKAKLFDDHDIAAKILAEKWPPNQKRLGRQVKNFRLSTWDHYKYQYVKALCLAKFQQNEDLKEWFISLPNNSLFVEASPFDRIWGVELPDYAPEIKDPAKWRGENLLGFVHTDNFRIIKGIKHV